MKILYNEQYGGFGLSKAFLAEYNARTGKNVSLGIQYSTTDPTSKHFLRSDPVAIAIYEERGFEWSSGPSCTLEVFEFPAVFANCWEIKEHDGMEEVHVNPAVAFAEALHRFMKTRDIAALEIDYAILTEAQTHL